MEKEDQRETIITQLEVLNRAVAVQNSLAHMFLRGIIYGVGFFIGSAIIATIVLGIVGPIVGQIPWVRTAFEVGHSLGR